MTDDRRNHPRVEASLQVEYKSMAALVKEYSSDISGGGLFLPTTNLSPIGSVILLKMKMPNQGPELKAIARVVRVIDEAEAQKMDRKPGMGMEFLDVGGTPVNHQIARFLAKRTGRAPSPNRDDHIKAHVLVVDDNEVHLNRNTDAIQSVGHEVTTARDGVEALRIAVRQKLDLIVTDVQMPNMNGWHLLRMIRNRSSLSSLPVIFLTSLNNEEERLMGYKLGVDDFIGKEFSDQELILRVQRVLERSQARKGTAKEKALRGDLTHVSLGSLLSLLEMERRTGHLLLIHGNQTANLFLNAGKVVNIKLSQEHLNLSPLERFFHILDWTDGEFELSQADVTAEDTIGVKTSFVLLEHARKKDEN